MHFCAKEMMMLMMVVNPVTYLVVRHYMGTVRDWVRER